MYSNYSCLFWFSLILFLSFGTNVVSAFDRRVQGRVMVEFDRAADDADANRDSKILLNHLQNKFPDVSLSIPRVLDYNLMRAATLQMDIDKEDLHDTILQAAMDTGLVIDVYPLHTFSRPIAEVDPVSFANKDDVSSLHRRDIPDSDLLMPHTMTQVDRLHNEHNNTGDGIFIAILDDGIDYLHPALGGGFGPGYKVRYGRDFVGVPLLTLNQTDGSTNNIPDDDPYDECYTKYNLTGGHGTHVAGIIGGKSDNFTGVAPDAILGMYRVNDCKGAGSSEIVIEGMLAAQQDGAQIISMSLSFPEGWSERAVAVVAERIGATGVIIVVSAGNDGQRGAFTVGSPSSAKGVVSVASFDNNYTIKETINVAGFDEAFDISIANETLGTLPAGELIPGDNNGAGGDSDACDPGDIPSNVQGKLAIVQRGGCTFDIKVQNLESAGSIGVIIYHNQTEDAPFLPLARNVHIPVVGLSEDDGTTVLEAIHRQSQQELTVTPNGRVISVPSGNTVSSFTSTGPSYENDFRPNIAAVGGKVYSTYPRSLGSWKVMSGTSMSCPYVSGTFALYLKALQDSQQTLIPVHMLEKYQNYAYKALTSSQTDNVTDTPYRQGAGLIQVYDAIYERIHVSPGSLSFNDTANLNKTQTLTIFNNGDDIAWYDIENRVSVSLEPYKDTSSYEFNTPAKYIDGSTARLHISRKTVRISPGASAQVTVTVIPPDTDPSLHIMYSGFVEFKSRLPEQHKDITVPYIGIAGNQRDLPMFKDSPTLEDIEGMFVYDGPDDVFEFDSSDNTTSPAIFLALAIPSARVHFRLHNETSQQDIGYAFAPLKYTTRVMSEEKPFTFANIWDGSYFEALPPAIGERIEPKPSKLKVSPGRYRIIIQVLRIFGNLDDRQDWDTWTSAVINVV
ncbi:peptidase S8/S53 domain-containing protein [Phascolomyces articulosus]|uniref:Peptidase S8/S53 domain-containing protein n=1 Tax=Phascolomyces articulosus TaxID=60185 RepID=A0AAD5JNI6_9FUNG|nr:peptidase S8/S53 domain-containing protein [Phascolomyces articulosus]